MISDGIESLKNQKLPKGIHDQNQIKIQKSDLKNQRGYYTGHKNREDSHDIIEDGVDYEDGPLEPETNLDAKQIKQQVYEEMKVNCINVEHLIHLLRHDRKNGEDPSIASTHKLKGMQRSVTS